MIPGTLTSVVNQPQNTSLFATSSLNEPITYSATGLPPGLSLDPQTGEITGTIPLQAASPSIFQRNRDRHSRERKRYEDIPLVRVQQLLTQRCHAS